MIPCDPVAHLNYEYGKDNWITPLSKGYKWENVMWKDKAKWTDSEWLYAVRYYHRNGNLDSNKTLKFLNMHQAIEFKSLPEDS